MSHTQQWVESAAKAPNVDGFMYTTWRNNYTAMEEFARVVQKASGSKEK